MRLLHGAALETPIGYAARANLTKLCVQRPVAA